MITIFLIMHFPAHNLTAIDIFHHVQIIMLTNDATWAIGDIPAPELIGLRCRKTAQLVIRYLCFRPAAMRQLIGRFQNAIEAGF